MKRYHIGVAFGWGCPRTLIVAAENAMEAVIIALCEMGLTSLVLVTGITIGEL